MSRNKKEKYQQHHLLNQDCRKYMESAISEYHNIGYHFVEHFQFLLFWHGRMQEKASPKNAMLCAFRFIEFKNATKNERIVTEKYFDKIINYYNHYPDCNTEKPEGISIEEWEKSPTMKKFNEGKAISQWIKSYRTRKRKPSEYVITYDINWIPKIEGNKWSRQEKIIARQCSFSWSIARLWQILRNQEKEWYIHNFIGIPIKEEPKKKIASPTFDKDLAELKESLKNPDSEEISFFERHLYLFDSQILSGDELCAFWKKACVSSIKGKRYYDSIRQPLDKIWLLARFFGVHFYDIDFINSKRGLPERLVKQIETLANPNLFEETCHQDVLRLCKKKNLDWGSKGLPAEEIISTLASEKEFEGIIKKALEIFSDFQENPEKTFVDKASSKHTPNSILNFFSFSKNKKDSEQMKKVKAFIIKLFQENKSTYISYFLYVATIDFLLTIAFDDNDADERDDGDIIDKIKDIENIECDKEISSYSEKHEGKIGVVLHLLSSIISWALKHEKNVILISNNDIEKPFWKKVFNVITFLTLILAIEKICQTSEKDKAKE